MDAAPATNLEVVDTDDLIRELKRRFTAMVLIAERPHFKNPDLLVTVFAWGGKSPNHALGLTIRAHGEMERKVQLSTLEEPEEE